MYIPLKNTLLDFYNNKTIEVTSEAIETERLNNNLNHKY